MKKLNMKMIIILIIAFFVVVGILAAIAALASKGKGKAGGLGTPGSSSNQTVQNQVVNNTNTVENTTPSGGGVTLEGFDKYSDSVDLELLFESGDIDSLKAYSAAGINMEEAKFSLEFDMFYEEEINGSNKEELIKEFQESFVSRNVTEYDMDSPDLDNLYASKLVVVNEECYFGINNLYAYAVNGPKVEVFDITDRIKEFAFDMPTEVAADFRAFNYYSEEYKQEFRFEDESDVNQIREMFYSYKVDASTSDYTFIGTMKFDDGNELEVYEDAFGYIGVYKTGRDSKNVMLNKDSIDSMNQMVSQAMGN